MKSMHCHESAGPFDAAFALKIRPRSLSAIRRRLERLLPFWRLGYKRHAPPLRCDFTPQTLEWLQPQAGAEGSTSDAKAPRISDAATEKRVTGVVAKAGASRARMLVELSTSTSPAFMCKPVDSPALSPTHEIMAPSVPASSGVEVPRAISKPPSERGRDHAAAPSSPGPSLVVPLSTTVHGPAGASSMRMERSHVGAHAQLVPHGVATADANAELTVREAVPSEDAFALHRDALAVGSHGELAFREVATAEASLAESIRREVQNQLRNAPAEGASSVEPSTEQHRGRVRDPRTIDADPRRTFQSLLALAREEAFRRGSVRR